MRIYYSKEEVYKLSRDHDIERTYEELAVIAGWVGRPNELLQVL